MADRVRARCVAVEMEVASLPPVTRPDTNGTPCVSLVVCDFRDSSRVCCDNGEALPAVCEDVDTVMLPGAVVATVPET